MLLQSHAPDKQGVPVRLCNEGTGRWPTSKWAVIVSAKRAPAALCVRQAF